MLIRRTTQIDVADAGLGELKLLYGFGLTTGAVLDLVAVLVLAGPALLCRILWLIVVHECLPGWTPEMIRAPLSIARFGAVGGEGGVARYRSPRLRLAVVSRRR
ncbi:hypothetical protein ACLOJK_014746 [Asimina triloba]